MAAVDDELTMNETATPQTQDTTPDPATFDLAAWVEGVIPATRTVVLYARGDLFGTLSRLTADLTEAKAAADTERKRRIRDEISAVTRELKDSSLAVTVQGRSTDWITRFRADHAEEGKTEDDLVMEQIAAQIIDPPGFTLQLLRTLRDRIEPQIVDLVSAVAAVNATKPAISVPS